MYMVVWGNAFFTVGVASNSKKGLYSGLYSFFSHHDAECLLDLQDIHTFSLFCHCCLTTYRMMLFSPGMFLYARYFCLPSLVADWCSLIQVPKALLISPMYSFTELQGTLYTTPALLRGGSTFFTLVSCRLSVETVVNTVLMSNILRILLRSSLNPDTYDSQILYFGFFSFCSLFLCFCDNLIMWTEYPLALKIFVICFTPFLTFSPIVIGLALLNRHEATPL